MKRYLFILFISIAVNSYSQTNKQIRVNLCDSSHKVYDGTLTEFDNSNSDAVDGRDAVKMNNFQWNFGLLRDQTNLIIERRKTVDTIFFNMWGMKPLSYSLEINSIGLPPGKLEDKYLGITRVLEDNAVNYYPFKVDTAKDSYRPDRFRIIFNVPASKTIGTKVTVYPNPSSKWINYKIEGKAGAYRVYFYNDAGLQVYARKATVINNDFSQRIYLTGGSKFYTLKVVDPDSRVATTKIIILDLTEQAIKMAAIQMTDKQFSSKIISLTNFDDIDAPMAGVNIFDDIDAER